MKHVCVVGYMSVYGAGQLIFAYELTNVKRLCDHKSKESCCFKFCPICGRKLRWRKSKVDIQREKTKAMTDAIGFNKIKWLTGQKDIREE